MYKLLAEVAAYSRRSVEPTVSFVAVAFQIARKWFGLKIHRLTQDGLKNLCFFETVFSFEASIKSCPCNPSVCSVRRSTRRISMPVAAESPQLVAPVRAAPPTSAYARAEPSFVALAGHVMSPLLPAPLSRVKTAKLHPFAIKQDCGIRMEEETRFALR